MLFISDINVTTENNTSAPNVFDKQRYIIVIRKKHSVGRRRQSISPATVHP